MSGACKAAGAWCGVLGGSTAWVQHAAACPSHRMTPARAPIQAIPTATTHTTGTMESDKIQQYVLLAKSARGRSLAELITQCTSNPGLFAFGELLAHPSVQEVRAALARAGASRVERRSDTPPSPCAPAPAAAQLRGGEFAPFLQLLELFCYGTWAEAKGARSRSCASACMQVQRARRVLAPISYTPPPPLERVQRTKAHCRHSARSSSTSSSS